MRFLETLDCTTSPGPDRKADDTRMTEPGKRSVFRRQRRTHELLVVTAGDLLQRLSVEELFVGGGEPEGPGRLPAIAEEPLDTGGPEEQEQSSFRGIDVEPVGDVARAIDDRARDRFDHGLTVLDTNLAGEDHEKLVLPSVDMDR